MTKDIKAKLAYGAWGAAFGAVIATVIGFSAGGWVTPGAVAKLTEAAVLNSRSEICVAQFQDAPNFEARLEALQDTDSMAQYRFIEKGGWDRMPGEEMARGFVSSACAQGVLELAAK